MENKGLKHACLEILDYQDNYPMIYEEEKNNLLNIYQDKIRNIEHVGSTSIKDIKSKPIIDIMIETDDLNNFKEFTESSVIGENYNVRYGSATPDYLVRRVENDTVKAYIHVYQTGDINAKRLVLFRDYLNTHEDERKRYEDLKIDLYHKYKNDRNKYVLGKVDYINSVIEKIEKQ